jgi:hypothetical protein
MTNMNATFPSSLPLHLPSSPDDERRSDHTSSSCFLQAPPFPVADRGVVLPRPSRVGCFCSRSSFRARCRQVRSRFEGRASGLCRMRGEGQAKWLGPPRVERRPGWRFACPSTLIPFSLARIARIVGRPFDSQGRNVPMMLLDRLQAAYADDLMRTRTIRLPSSCKPFVQSAALTPSRMNREPPF